VRYQAGRASYMVERYQAGRVSYINGEIGELNVPLGDTRQIGW
jgi:hypothetical protein